MPSAKNNQNVFMLVESKVRP